MNSNQLSNRVSRFSNLTSNQHLHRYPRVAIAIETSQIQGREIIRGIMQYTRLHTRWEFCIISPFISLSKQLDMKQWDGSGIITRGFYHHEVLATGLPVVFCDLQEDQLRQPGHLCTDYPEVRINDFRVGELGAEYFIKQMYRHFAYCGTVFPFTYSQDREIAFCRRLEQEGYSAHVYRLPSKISAKWENEQKCLATWLRSLPKPIGLMAVNDPRGQQIVSTCLSEGIIVPEEVAVLGVDNDELFCELSDIPLSSIPINARLGGIRAAELLDLQFQNTLDLPKTSFVEPFTPISRQSTDYFPVDDPLVSKALRFIRMNVRKPISANMVAQYLNCSRQTLRIRFLKTVGHSVHEEIVLLKMDLIRQYLRETNCPLHEIASRVGFSSQMYLCEFFLRHAGQTPGEYRQENP
ncbi:MAG: DNA-binding transcriptional regulator [Planctomycetia bacterium]|nr:DNA-binding transcriptional regulator [Planctomycetia bacterium]